jgi:hypothetical protein
MVWIIGFGDLERTPAQRHLGHMQDSACVPDPLLEGPKELIPRAESLWIDDCRHYVQTVGKRLQMALSVRPVIDKWWSCHHI